MNEQQKILNQLPKTFPNPSTMFKTGIEQVEIARKGGLVTGPTKSLGAKLRWLKKKGLTDENSQHLYEVLMDAKLSSLDTRLVIEKMKSKATTVEEINMLVKNMNQWHRLHHGSKDKTDIVNTLQIDNSKQITFSFEIPKEFNDEPKVLNTNKVLEFNDEPNLQEMSNIKEPK